MYYKIKLKNKKDQKQNKIECLAENKFWLRECDLSSSP